MSDVEIPADGLPQVSGVVRTPSIEGLPEGYVYGVTRFADLILRDAFEERFDDFVTVLSEFQVSVYELLQGGGGRASMTSRFDAMLGARGWGKRVIEISKRIDNILIHSTRGHEIDMFGVGSRAAPYPGIAIEMEWNNKDPFFDRDLLNFMALHREGALAVGIIITRGPTLQRIAGPVIKTSSKSNNVKYGQSSTHWDKLIPRLNLGGGGECPIIVVGIEPPRIDGFDVVVEAYESRQPLW